VDNALLVGLSRQIALARELDVIANNVANAGTNGFKARSARFAEYVMPVAAGEAFPNADRRISYVIDKGTPLDMATGPLERTGNPLDVALQGNDFLVVQTPQGERYSRAGSLALNAQGELVTQGGLQVLGQNGPIRFGPSEAGLGIAADGTVSSDQGVRGRLRLVRFEDMRSLRSAGENLFSSDQPAQPAGPQARLETGTVERSNVRPVVELSRLVEVQRAYTAIANLMTKSDELRSRAISRLADMN
jgi:flagellar basal-body rod protein FlgF